MKLIKMLFNWMRKVKHMCNELKYGCESCPFYTNKNGAFNNCKLMNMVWAMHSRPADWEVDKIEKEWDE